VIAFAAVAWALIATFGVRKTMQGTVAGLYGIQGYSGLSLEQKLGGLLFVFFVVFWISEGILKELLPLFVRYELYICIGFFMLFIYLTFLKPLGEGGAPILRLKHTVRGLPKRGILFLCIVALIIPVIRLFQLDKHAAGVFSAFIRPEASVFFVFFGTTLGVIFLTEVLSNTVVSTAFFPIVYFTSTAYNIPPLILMIAVSIASTCAFMTPIATPCNALAFGEMKGTSLGRMLVLGFPLNIIGALLITLWLQFVIPLVYS
jgi:sodium-dependent dicarboxylate transporter 2/3/5